MNKILFLDIDGVLIPYDQKDNHSFDVHRVALLKEFLDKSGYKIVISSSWRRQGLDEDSILFRQLHKHELLDYIKFPQWKTNLLANAWGEETEERGAKINNYTFFNDVDEYIILDDINDGFNEAQKKRFVQTNSNKGLTRKDLTKLTRLCPKLDVKRQALK
jgi:hypothetical protein